MTKENFPFNKKSPAPAKSVLDRANDLFHFENSFKGKNLPPLDIPADMVPPARPVAEPAPVKAAPSQPAPAQPAVPTPPVDHAAPVLAVAQQHAPVSAPAAPAFRAKDWTGPVHHIDVAKMAEAGFLVPEAQASGTAEEFRIIRRELLAYIRGGRHHQAVPKGNVILIASAHSGDGKTYCAINLAVSLAAESGVEVLLIDGDFAKPGVADALGVEPAKGLMDALADPSLHVSDMVMRTDIPSLSILQAGTDNPEGVELLASPRMDIVIDELVAGRPERVLILDSPPLLAASPAAVLAGHVGQTVLIVRADRTSEGALRDAAGLLKECENIRMLLNGVQPFANERRFGSYYGKETTE